jgi:protein-tyrosine phosphatase
MSFIGKIKRWVGGSNATAGAAGPEGTADDGRLYVLMVCTGNICRSPIAEGVLRAKLQAAGLADRVVVDSAGTHGYHTSEPPDPRAIRAAAQRGYDIKGLRARPVDAGDYEDFDWMLALDAGHLSWLQRKAPEAHNGRVELLMSHASRHAGTQEVPDPYYGPDAGFEHVLDLVEDACDGVVAALHQELGRKVR